MDLYGIMLSYLHTVKRHETPEKERKKEGKKERKKERKKETVDS